MDGQIIKEHNEDELQKSIHDLSFACQKIYKCRKYKQNNSFLGDDTSNRSSNSEENIYFFIFSFFCIAYHKDRDVDEKLNRFNYTCKTIRRKLQKSHR